MRDKERSRKEVHSGDYVASYEARPISRISRLVDLMGLANTDDLVDIACGNAMLLEAVSGRIRSYTGVDFSDDFIVAAKKRADRIGAVSYDFHCDDIVDFCTRTKRRYSVAVALDFSEHVLTEDLVPILSAVRSILKPGGRLYLHTPNLDFFTERMRDSGFILKQRPEHIAVRDRAQNVAMLIEAGFDESSIKVRLLSHYNALKALHPLRHLPFLGKFFEARIFIECAN